MGVFDRWFGAKKPVGSESLRDALFTAVAAGDDARLSDLCRQHRAAIVERFAEWQKVPPEVRSDSARIPVYAQGLIGVASHLAQAGHPELMARLMPKADANPIAGYQRMLEGARGLMDDLRYDVALERLQALIADLGKVQGSAVDRYLPTARGFVSECQFHRGDVEAAIAPALEALADCVRLGDIEGVSAYQGNLYEIHRYLGQAERAAHYAEQRASSCDATGNPELARWHRTQAPIVRAGEPLNRVIALVGETRYELDAVPPEHSGRIQFLFQRNRITLRPAAVAIEQAATLASDGEHNDALAALERAAQLDAFTPEPSYLGGLSLLHLERYAEAVLSYARCDALAPGWFHVRADHWFAEQLNQGQLEHATFLHHLELTDGAASPDQKLQLASRVLGAAPHLAPFHLHRGKAFAALDRHADAIKAFRDGLACDCDAATRTSLLVELATRLDTPERLQLLESAVALDGNRIAAAMARVMLHHAPN